VRAFIGSALLGVSIYIFIWLGSRDDPAPG
jgi:hypothetical protein